MGRGQWQGVGGVQGDPTIPRQPWDALAYSAAASPAAKRLRVGVWGAGEEFDGFFHLAPACRRAVAEAAAALEAAGHEVVTWSPRSDAGMDTARAAVLVYAMLGADGALFSFKSGLEGEALHANYSTLHSLASIPTFLLGTLASVLRHLLGWTRAADLLTNARARSAREYWQLCQEREILKRDFIADIQTRGFDCVLCPALGTPAFLHGQSRDLTLPCSPCFVWNLLGFPAVVLPCTRQRQGEDEYQAPPGQRGDVFFREAVRAVAGAEGMPVGVQLAGLPFTDETLLGAATALERALKEIRGGAAEEGVPEGVLTRTLSHITP